MYYVWDENVEIPSVICGVMPFENMVYCGFNEGVPLGYVGDKYKEVNVPDPIVYWTPDKNPIYDRVSIGWSSKWVLISDRARRVLDSVDMDNVVYFRSVINRVKKKRENVLETLEGYWTLHTENIADCIDFNKSVWWDEDHLKRGCNLRFRKIVLDYSKIPENMKIFVIKHMKILIIVHQDIKDAFEKNELIGGKFIPLNEYEDYLLPEYKDQVVNRDLLE